MKYSIVTAKGIFLAIMMIALSQFMMAQNKTITGTIIDSETKNAVCGAVITMGNNKVVFTDIDGRFSIPSDNGYGTITCTYIGYKPLIIDVSVRQNLGLVEMKTEAQLLTDVVISSQLAVPRKTPIAVTNVLASQIEERLGNDEFVEAMKYAPGVHPNRQGGSWADSEIFVRGFDNTNVATLINGIPVNDMENGTVYWSNWASLSEVASVVQVQRGIGATKLSAPSVGGTINIITKGIETKKVVAYPIL